MPLKREMSLIIGDMQLALLKITGHVILKINSGE